MRDVCLRGSVSTVSRRAHRAPFAITSDGEVLVNVAMFDVAKKLDVLLAAARRQDGDVFIGVALSPSEVTFALTELHHACRDTSSWVVGGRRRKKNNKPKNKETAGEATSSRRRRSSPSAAS